MNQNYAIECAVAAIEKRTPPTREEFEAREKQCEAVRATWKRPIKTKAQIEDDLVNAGHYEWHEQWLSEQRDTN